ncbi:hypothetical protein V6Z11_A03G043600 [Gossypium hirsutum]
MPIFLQSIQILNRGDSVNTCTLACKKIKFHQKNQVGNKINAPNINRPGEVGFKSNQSGSNHFGIKTFTLSFKVESFQVSVVSGSGHFFSSHLGCKSFEFDGQVSWIDSFRFVIWIKVIPQVVQDILRSLCLVGVRFKFGSD